MISCRHQVMRADAGGQDCPGASPEGSRAAAPRESCSGELGVPGVCGFLVLAVSIVFGQTVGYPFVSYDDPEYVYENPHVTCGLNIHDIAWAFTASRESNWHPLTWISHQLDWQIYGNWAGGHHLGNVLLHCLTAVLLFLVLQRMSGRLWRSALVAALFALHPLRVESVAWVAERKDVLCGLFFVLTLAAYAGYVRRPFSLARYLAVLGPYALGLMCKPMLLTVPFVLLLLDYWPLGRLAGYELRGVSARLAVMGRLLLEKTPLLLLSAASCIVTFKAQHQSMASVTSLPLVARSANAVLSYAGYLGKAFWPANLAVFYPHAEDRFLLGAVAGSAMLLLGITVATLVLRRRCPYLLMGWLWYIGMLLPVIGIVQVGKQASADRYTYLPMIGLCIAVVWGVGDVLVIAPRYRRVACWGMALLLAILMGTAWRQTGFWRNSETLWTRDLAIVSNNAVAHINLGRCYYEAHRFPETIEQSRQALLLEPDNPQAHYNLGLVLDRLGRPADAIEQYRRAIRAEPDYVQARYNLGCALDQLGRPADAIEQYRRAIQAEPDYAQAHHNLGHGLYESGNTAEAIEHYRRALRIDPAYALAHFNLARALFNSGQTAEAIEHYRQAVRLKPDYASACNNLGNALLKLGRLAEAIQQYEQAVKVQPDYTTAHCNLGLCLAKIGRRREALEHLEHSRRLAEAAGQTPLAQVVLSEIQRLRENKP